MSVVFISYRRDDSSGQARALSKSLEEVVGKDSVFIDVDSIEVGVDVRRVLEARLKAADIMFALIGPRWLEDEDGAGHRRLDDPKDFVRQEIASALARNDIKVMPVLVGGALTGAGLRAEIAHAELRLEAGTPVAGLVIRARKLDGLSW